MQSPLFLCYINVIDGEKMTQAYIAGYLAYPNSIINPYISDTQDYKDWWLGYTTAQTVSEAYNDPLGLGILERV